MVLVLFTASMPDPDPNLNFIRIRIVIKIKGRVKMNRIRIIELILTLFSFGNIFDTWCVRTLRNSVPCWQWSATPHHSGSRASSTGRSLVQCGNSLYHGISDGNSEVVPDTWKKIGLFGEFISDLWLLLTYWIALSRSNNRDCSLRAHLFLS